MCAFVYLRLIIKSLIRSILFASQQMNRACVYVQIDTGCVRTASKHYEVSLEDLDKIIFGSLNYPTPEERHADKVPCITMGIAQNRCAVLLETAHAKARMTYAAVIERK